MHRSKRSSWWERGAINLGVALGIGGLVVVGAGAGMGMQRTVLASEDGPVATAGAVRGRGPVPVFACPGEDPVGSLHNGDRIFATGVHPDLDGWLRIRHPLEGQPLWIEARFVAADASAEGLPEVLCDEVTVTFAGEPTTTTSSSTTTTRPGQEPSDDPDGPDDPSEPAPTPTTQPSSGGGGGGGGSSDTTTTQPSGGGDATTTTTEAPDTTGPSIGSLGASPSQIDEDGTAGNCSPIKSTISVAVSDPSGIDSAAISWKVGDETGSKGMSVSGGTASTWVGDFPDDTIPPSPPYQAAVQLTITVHDGAGNQSTKTSSSALTLTDCTFS